MYKKRTVSLISVRLSLSLSLSLLLSLPLSFSFFFFFFSFFFYFLFFNTSREVYALHAIARLFTRRAVIRGVKERRSKDRRTGEPVSSPRAGWSIDRARFRGARIPLGTITWICSCKTCPEISFHFRYPTMLEPFEPFHIFVKRSRALVCVYVLRRVATFDTVERGDEEGRTKYLFRSFASLSLLSLSNRQIGREIYRVIYLSTISISLSLIEKYKYRRNIKSDSDNKCPVSWRRLFNCWAHSRVPR